MASIGVVINVVVIPPSGAATHCRARRGIHAGATLDRPSARQAMQRNIGYKYFIENICFDDKLIYIHLLSHIPILHHSLYSVKQICWLGKEGGQVKDFYVYNIM